MNHKTKSAQELRDEIIKKGKTIKEVADSIGCSYRTVYTLLNGSSRGRRGEAHRAAVALGLKEVA